MQHNTTAPVETMPGVFQDLPFYTAGLRDIPAVFFYLLISVVMHAIIQEYLLDKVNKKLHLSKVKYNKFNESGQLLAFYLVSLFWGGDLLLRENLLSVSSIWEGYPHNNMTFCLSWPDSPPSSCLSWPRRERPRKSRRTVTFLRLTRRRTSKGMTSVMMDLSVMNITHHCVT